MFLNYIVQLNILTVGLAWYNEQRVYLQALDPFNQEDCVIKLVFNFPDSTVQFPRKQEVIERSYADFLMLHTSYNMWQEQRCSMTFDNIDFNKLTKSQSEQVHMDKIWFQLMFLLTNV